jgi:hypothetical protein
MELTLDLEYDDKGNPNANPAPVNMPSGPPFLSFSPPFSPSFSPATSPRRQQQQGMTAGQVKYVVKKHDKGTSVQLCHVEE